VNARRKDGMTYSTIAPQARTDVRRIAETG
jgi:hypothetical protein